jgi:hypothetical protein
MNHVHSINTNKNPYSLWTPELEKGSIIHRRNSSCIEANKSSRNADKGSEVSTPLNVSTCCTLKQDECLMPSYLDVVQTRTKRVIHACLIALVFSSDFQVFLLVFLSFFFLHPVPYSVSSFLEVTVLHYSVFTKVVHNETSNWVLVGCCTEHIAMPSAWKRSEQANKQGWMFQTLLQSLRSLFKSIVLVFFKCLMSTNFRMFWSIRFQFFQNLRVYMYVYIKYWNNRKGIIESIRKYLYNTEKERQKNWAQ